jgi:DNA-binding PadR family transcriptional regulator
MKRFRRPSPQTLAVLRALAEESAEWSYGYDLGRSLGLKAGTIYPILIRLNERGYVAATWESDPPPGRPARHLYRLTPTGVELIANLQRTDTAQVQPDLAPRMT